MSSFGGYFFSLSTAELLVAQNLGNRYRFAFVNTRTRKHEGSIEQLSVTGRETCGGVRVKFNLRTVVQCINMRVSQPRLSEYRISHAVSAPEVVAVSKSHSMHRGVVEKRLGHHVQVTTFPAERAT